MSETETVYANVEEATRALTGDTADYTAPIGQPTPGGRYEEMPLANPLPKETFGETTFEGREGIKQAAEQVAARRTPTKDELQALSPVEISYRGIHNGKAGETVKPSHEIVDASQAAWDLATFRENLQQQEQNAADEILRHLVDAERGQQTTEAIGAEPQQQTEQPQPTPEQQQTTAEEDPVTKALSDPRVLSAVQEYVGQAQAQANAQAQFYSAAVANNAAVAMNAVLHAYPELQGLNSPEQLRTAIGVVAKQNPERAQQMVRHIEGTRALFEEQQRVQRVQAQAYQQQAQAQWSQYTQAHDDAFARFAKDVPAEELRAIKDETIAALHESGMSDQDIAWRWNNDATFRSYQAQRLMYDSAKFRLAQKAEAAARERINHKRDRTPPTVQHPGSPNEVASREDYGLRELNMKLNNASDRKSQLKAAADLVMARRAQRR